MTSKKRGAEVQLTKDNPEETEQTVESGTWKEASEDKLKQRKLVKIKRKKGGPPNTPQEEESRSAAEEEPVEQSQEESSVETSASLLPKFDFGVESSPATSSLFDWTAKETKEGQAPETSSSSEDSWATSNFSWGADSDNSTGFSFDPKSFKSFDSLASAAGTESAFSFATQSESSSFADAPTPSNTGAEVFQDKKAEDSGTKEDTTLLRILAKVYVMKDKNSQNNNSEPKETPTNAKNEGSGFAEAGHGDLHINTFIEDGKTRARLVLRMEKTQRLVLNAPIFKGMDYQIQGEKFLRVVSFGLEGEPKLFLLKFKSKEDTNLAKKKVDECLKLIDAQDGQEPEPEPEPEQGQGEGEVTEGVEAGAQGQEQEQNEEQNEEQNDRDVVKEPALTNEDS